MATVVQEIMYAKCGVLVIFLCYLNIGLHLVYGYEQQGRAINSPENRRVRHPGYYIPKVKSAESVLADRQLLHDQQYEFYFFVGRFFFKQSRHMCFDVFYIIFILFVFIICIVI